MAVADASVKEEEECVRCSGKESEGEEKILRGQGVGGDVDEGMECGLADDEAAAGREKGGLGGGEGGVRGGSGPSGNGLSSTQVQSNLVL